MVMKVLREGAFGGFLKYILMSLLAMSVLGLVFMDVRGVLTGHTVGSTDVARVGHYRIGIREFDKLARLSLGRYHMTPQDAYAKDRSMLMNILNGEVRSYQVLLESEDLGINIPQKKLQEQLIVKIKPSQEEGETLQQTLDRILQSQGISESDFLKSYNREVVGDVMIGVLQSGFENVSKDLAEDLFRLQNHSRDIELISFHEADIKDFESPDEEKLKKLYETYKNSQFKIAERRVFEIAYIDDKKLRESLDISEDTIRKFYDDHLDEFEIPEQRVLEQIVVPTEELANKILDMVKNEKAGLSEAKSKVSPKEGTYIPSSPLSEDMLLPDLKDTIMNAKIGDTVGPVKTIIGFHLMTIKDVIPPHTRSYEESRDAIKKELEDAELADSLYERSDELNDLLSGGNSFEEASKTVPLTITVLPAFTSAGFDENGKDMFEESDEQGKADKDTILQEGFALQPDETSRVFEMPSGRFAAIRVQDILPESYHPFEDVKEKLAKQFVEDQQRSKNFEKIFNFYKEIRAGEKTFEDVAKEAKIKVETLKDIKLSGPLPSPLTDAQRPDIFQAKMGDVLTMPFDGGASLVLVKSVHIPDVTEEFKPQIEKIQERVGEELQSEVFAYYVYQVGFRHSAIINYDLIKSVYATAPSGDDQ
ncbi:MAG: peptidyl-prolyl cis-trans isomerase [Rhodospirillales bacterium]|nr:peptidyl-prolyl cis-trans isomerase [Rhodospirillales bacterium]